MTELLFTNVRVFDGSGSALFPADVRVRGNRIVAVASRGSEPREARVINGEGGTLMPGLIEAHAHLDFGASVGRIPANTFKMTPCERMLSATFAARTLLDYGFTSAYSAGCINEIGDEVALKKEIEQGWTPGPRMKACAGQWMPGLSLGPATPSNRFGIVDWKERPPAPQAARDHVKAKADAGAQVIKLGLNGESGLVPGTSHTLLFHEVEMEAVMEAVRDRGLEASAHTYTDEAVRMALKHGVRTLYHCAFMDPSTVDLIEDKRDEVFIAPGPGILWATVHESGLPPPVIEKMEAAPTLDGSRKSMPPLRARGIRVLPGGDYGFAFNPNGRNARDLALFVSEYGFTPAESLKAATAYGGELMGMGSELGQVKPGYLADLLVVNGDPLKDITLLQDRDRLRLIMKDGRIHKTTLEEHVVA